MGLKLGFEKNIKNTGMSFYYVVYDLNKYCQDIGYVFIIFYFIFLIFALSIALFKIIKKRILFHWKDNSEPEHNNRD